MRRFLISLVLGALLALTAVLPTLGRVDGACPRGQGWDHFQVFLADGTFRMEAWLAEYPTNQRALDEGIYTAEDLEAGLRAADRNTNGWLCVKDINAFVGGPGQGFAYYVSTVDDNAAPK